MNKKQIINQVKAIILQYANLERIYVYGSQLDMTTPRTSDIDIAYDDKDCKQGHLILADVEKLNTLVKIDVKNIAMCEERFANRVKDTGRVIFSKNKKLRAEDGLYNFSNALKKFSYAIEKEQELKEEGFADLYLDLIVKRFEFTYEMSWKAIKRYLEFLGFEIKNPRMAFKEGFAQGLCEDEQIFLDMIEQRNLSSHIYDEYEISDILYKLKDYELAFKQLEEKINYQLEN